MITDQKRWLSWVAANEDPYGKACVDVARRVMEIIDKEEPEELDTHELIQRADDEIDAGGITGYMAGAIATMVSQCHSRGAEFKKAWNKSYGCEICEGVVNPSIVNLNL